MQLSLREMSSPAQLAALENGLIHLGFVRPPVLDARFDIRLVQTEPFLGALPSDHPMASPDSVRLRDLPLVISSARRRRGSATRSCTCAGPSATRRPHPGRVADIHHAVPGRQRTWPGTRAALGPAHGDPRRGVPPVAGRLLAGGALRGLAEQQRAIPCEEPAQRLQVNGTALHRVRIDCWFRMLRGWVGAPRQHTARGPTSSWAPHTSSYLVGTTCRRSRPSAGPNWRPRGRACRTADCFIARWHLP